MKRFPLPLLALVLALCSFKATATDVPRSDADCRKILTSWAKDVKSVPRRLVNQCKEQIARIAPGAGRAAKPEAPKAMPTVANIEPCSGPEAMNSVLCWGPWAALAPAAGGVSSPAALVATEPLLQRAEVASPYAPGLVNPPPGTPGVVNPPPGTPGVVNPPPGTPGVVNPPPGTPGVNNPPPTLPLGSCAPGSSCGFATVVSGAKSCHSADKTTRITPFTMATNGSQFTVDSGGTPINSVTGMTTHFGAQTPPFQDLQACGSNGDQRSSLSARAIVNGNGDVDQAAGLWKDGNSATRKTSSGYFAWGIATTPEALNVLNAGSVTANYSGRMSVDDRTMASITVNFGAQPGWTGTWTNPGYTFGAGGRVSGADFASNPAQFTSNVKAGSYVQGILLGQPGNLGIAHAIDVTLTGAGHVQDVGLLRGH